MTAEHMDAIASFCERRDDAGQTSGWTGSSHQHFADFAKFLRSCRAEADQKHMQDKKTRKHNRKK
jgi:hypothetical protein